jgi:hypothetical protein
LKKFKPLKYMEIIITTGTYKTSDYRVVKKYKSLKAAEKFVKAKGYKSPLHNGLQFSSYGISYTVSL